MGLHPVQDADHSQNYPFCQLLTAFNLCVPPLKNRELPTFYLTLFIPFKVCPHPNLGWTWVPQGMFHVEHTRAGAWILS
ncbi:MAG: hypothetical protein ACYCOO_02500 [Chitinophagaceae bacterium]